MELVEMVVLLHLVIIMASPFLGETRMPYPMGGAIPFLREVMIS